MEAAEGDNWRIILFNGDRRATPTAGQWRGANLLPRENHKFPLGKLLYIMDGGGGGGEKRRRGRRLPSKHKTGAAGNGPNLPKEMP
jgi:hypothetical protein